MRGKRKKLTHNYDVKRAFAVYSKTDLNGFDGVEKNAGKMKPQKSLAFPFLPFCHFFMPLSLTIKKP